MEKLRVLVVYGGQSAEHEISLRSAQFVIDQLDRSRFKVIPLAIDKSGRWLLSSTQLLPTSAPIQVTGQEVIMLPQPQQLNATTSIHQLIFRQANNNTQPFDVVFPVLHGPLGEDGTIQGLFELANVPYVGCNVLSSAVCMDKAIAKALLKAAGLPIPDFQVIEQGEWQFNQATMLNEIKQHFKLPVFVKPANLGSSVGISKVKDWNYLEKAINEALRYDHKIVIEEGVHARELELAVLENLEYGMPPLVSLAGEIKPMKQEFYSYEAKYIDDDGADLIVPTPMTTNQLARAQTLAQQVFKVLNCTGMARVDLFFDEVNDRFFVNEANTIPGFTSISMYPKLWEATGIPGQQLLSHLIDVSINRHRRKQQLCRDWNK